MKQFTQLFLQLDRTNKTNEKVELLTSYFLTAPEEDKLWALALFTGRRPPRSIKTAQLHAWALEQTNIPEWLYRESYNSVGDMAETISLLLPANPSASNNSLSEWFHLLASMKNENDEAKKEFILSAWKQFSPHEIFVFNKLIMGSYRIGVSQTLVVRAVSEAVQQEAAVISKFLPDGTVLDGEIICFSNNKPMPFNVLQTRIGRKNITTKILQEAPVVFIAYDILEIGHVDVRNQSQEKRREQLEYLHSQTPSETVFRLSTLHQFTSWDDLKKLHLHSRENVAEGFMIKRKAAQYQTGRKKGDWWKWKIDPLSIDAVLIYAQKGLYICRVG